MITAPLKAITAFETVSGAKVDLSAQVSRHFQMGGTWNYNKSDSAFSLNTALLGDPTSQDSSFVAGTYHNSGKLESRGMVGIGNGVSLNGEAMFQGPDTRKAYYALEMNKNFDYFTAGLKVGTGMRAFSYMQGLWQGCFAGFECTYLV